MQSLVMSVSSFSMTVGSPNGLGLLFLVSSFSTRWPRLMVTTKTLLVASLPGGTVAGGQDCAHLVEDQDH